MANKKIFSDQKHENLTSQKKTNIVFDVVNEAYPK
jgi:hypothetical protein